MGRTILAVLLCLGLVLTACTVRDTDGVDIDVPDNVTGAEDAQGRVVFALSSRAATPGIAQALMEIDGVHLYDAREEDWEETPVLERSYDLVGLQREGPTALIVEDQVDAGAYSAFRIDIAELEIGTGDARLDEEDALMPEEEFIFNQEFTVREGETTVIVIDVLLNESLFATNTSGGFDWTGWDPEERDVLFMPSFNVRILESADVSGNENDLQISGDEAFSGRLGTNAQGEIVAGIPIPWDADVMIVDNNLIINGQEISADRWVPDLQER